MDIYFGYSATQLTVYNNLKNNKNKELKNLVRQKNNYQILLSNLLSSYNIYTEKFEKYELLEDLQDAISHNDFTYLLDKIEGYDNNKFRTIMKGFTCLWKRYYNLVGGNVYNEYNAYKEITFKSLFYDNNDEILDALNDNPYATGLNSIMFAYLLTNYLKNNYKQYDGSYIGKIANVLGIERVNTCTMDGFSVLYNYIDNSNKIAVWLESIKKLIVTDNANLNTFSYSKFYNTNDNVITILGEYREATLNDFKLYNNHYARMTDEDFKELNDLFDLYSIIYNLLLTKSIGNTYNILTKNIETIDNDINKLNRDVENINAAIRDTCNAASDNVPRLYDSPSAITSLVYNGQSQELINPGYAANGTLEYKIDNNEWSEDIPKAENSGNYVVYYRVVPYAADKDPLTSDDYFINCTIAKANAVINTPVIKQNLKYLDGNPINLIEENSGTINGIPNSILYSINGGEYSTNTTVYNAGDYVTNWKYDEQFIDLNNYVYPTENNNININGTIEHTVEKAEPNINVEINNTISINEHIIPTISGTINGGYDLLVEYKNKNIGSEWITIYKYDSTTQNVNENGIIENTGNYFVRVIVKPKNLDNYTEYSELFNNVIVVNNSGLNSDHYYWYIGISSPLDTITEVLSEENNTSGGWRDLGDTLQDYTASNPLWSGNKITLIPDSENSNYYYIALPYINDSHELHCFNTFNEDVMVIGNPPSFRIYESKMINGKLYKVWISQYEARGFSYKIY